MIARLLRFVLGALLWSQLSVTSFTAAADEAPPGLPSWLSNVPVLSFSGERSFQFRTRVGASGPQFIFYTSWAPPDHRAMVLCDSSDGLPLIYSVDGDTWSYDLISGQILHVKNEPKFKFGAGGSQLNFEWGFVPPTEPHGIQVDLASFLTGFTQDIKSSASARRRGVLGTTSRGSKILLEARKSDPPLPEEFLLVLPPDAPLPQIECDSFHYDEALPAWHRTLDPAMLAKDVPYLDGTAMKIEDLPKDQAGLVKLGLQIFIGQGTFLVRTALREPSFRDKVQRKFGALDFQQIELHEKLLKGAWLRALQHQGCDPGKWFAPTPPEPGGN